MSQHSEQPVRPLSTILDLLRDNAERPDAVNLVRAALQASDDEPVEVLAFVKTKRRGSVAELWGDNGYSFWAHLYAIQTETHGLETLVTLEAEGAIRHFIGLFATKEVALRRLRSMGKYQLL
jgi:hypothetical protein